MGDEKFYKRVEDELNGKPRKFTDKALWTKAEVLSKGDEEKTRYKYIELRVEKLVEEDRKRQEKREREEQEKLARQEIQKLKQEREEEEKAKEKKSFWTGWAFFLVAFIFGRYVGIVGFVAVFFGYLAYDHFAKKGMSTFNSLIISAAVALVVYFIGYIFFTELII